METLSQALPALYALAGALVGALASFEGQAQHPADHERISSPK